MNHSNMGIGSFKRVFIVTIDLNETKPVVTVMCMSMKKTIQNLYRKQLLPVNVSYNIGRKRTQCQNV